MTDKQVDILLQKNRRIIFSIINTYINDLHHADDLYQEVCIKILMAVRSGQYNEDGFFNKWASTITRNTCFSYLRKQKNRKEVFNIDTLIHSTKRDIEANDDEHYVHIEFVDLTDNERAVLERERAEIMKHIINNLPPLQRETIVLHYYFDLQYNDIAFLTGTNINTQLSRAHNAIFKMNRACQSSTIQ